MKKAVFALMTILAAVMICSVSAAAESAPKAPAKVWYKTVNHDRVTLKWEESEGADRYILYKLDSEGGEFTRVRELKTRTYILKGLEADTQYTYAVAAVRRSGGNAVQSTMRKVTFTTPEEWYYTKGNTDVTDISDPAYDYGNVYRHHYDGSGLEKFDYFPLLPEESLWSGEDGRDSFSLCAVMQKSGWVWLYLDRTGVLDDTITEVFRLRNDGEYIEQVNLRGDRPDRELDTDADTSFIGFESRIAGGEELYISDAAVQKTVIGKDGLLTAVTLFKGERSCLSNFAADGSYIYYFTTPYRKSEYDTYDFGGEEPDNKARLYRSSLTEPAVPAYSEKNGYLLHPAQDDVTDCLCETDCGSDGNTIFLIGVKNGFLYYVMTGEDSDKESVCSFYRISVTKDGAKPERLFRKKYRKLADVRINGNYIYIFADCVGYRVDLGGKTFRPKEFFRIEDEVFGWHFDSLTVSLYAQGKAPQVEIKNGYIYIKGRRDSTYYRVKLTGDDTRSSDTAYLYR